VFACVCVRVRECVTRVTHKHSFVNCFVCVHVCLHVCARQCDTLTHTHMQTRVTHKNMHGYKYSVLTCFQHHFQNINTLSFYTFGMCISAPNLEILTQLLESGHCAIV